MRKYHVVVNGTAYEVDVEEVTGGAPAAPVAVPAPAVAPAPVAAPAPAPVAAPAPAASGEGEKVTSPMPGTILKILAKVGQTVKSGEVIMILEAMKMENEIMAPQDGTVTSIGIAEGAAVESGTLLYTIA